MYSLTHIALSPLPLTEEQQQLAIPIIADIPKDMDVFFQPEASFLPNGKTFAQLTPEEVIELRNKYKYSPYRPGIYQAITWRTKDGQSL